MLSGVVGFGYGPVVLRGRRRREEEELLGGKGLVMMPSLPFLGPWWKEVMVWYGMVFWLVQKSAIEKLECEGGVGETESHAEMK